MIIYKQRKAIAMIELIFAIVIMGFAMMSIPNLLGMSAKSGYTALQQEAIATASSDISLIFARQWDESNALSSDYEKVLKTNGDSNLNDRDGGVTRVYDIPVAITATSAGALGPDLDDDGKDDSDDIDDADGDTSNMTDDLAKNSKTGSIDQNIRITTDVNYISDQENTGNWDSSKIVIYNYNAPVDINKISNIKNIKTTLTSNAGIKELEKNIVLFAFSCNIGGYKRDRKVLP